MTTELDLVPDTDRTPATLFASPDPAVIVAQATRIANEIAPLIRDQHLVKRIGQSDHVFLEGWTLAGTMLGVFPITVASGPIVVEGEVLGYQATVEARTMAGNMVGRADAQCTHDENEKWKHAPSFQLRSMAITRASSKALRMPLGFVMHLAGYDATPAEEMEQAAARGETVSGGHGVRPGWRDLAEQQRAHAAVGRLIDQHGLRSWVASWLESKSYERPLAKGQLNQLSRAIATEVAQMSDPASAPTPPGGGPGSDPMSGEEGERVRSGNKPRERRDDPSPSDPTSSPPLQGEGSGGEDPMSAAGSSPSTAGVSGEFAPVGSPAADQTSEAGERETATSVVDVTDHAGPFADRHDPASDPSSPTRPVSQTPGRVGGNVKQWLNERFLEEAEGVGSAEADPPRANGVPTVDTGAPAGPASDEELRPVFYWCQRHNVDMGLAATYLRRSHKKDFADLKDRADLAELQGPKVGLALDLLHQQFVVGRKR